MCCRCGNVAAILQLDEDLNQQFRVFEAAPQVPEFTFSVVFMCFAVAFLFDSLCLSALSWPCLSESGKCSN